jgi:hypothetical protein
MTQGQIDTLRQFFGAYFHQDWDLDESGPDGVIDRFINDSADSGKLNSLASLIDAFQDTYSDEAELEYALHADLWCEFDPRGEGMSTRSWLRHVSMRLREATSDVMS